MSQHVLQQRIYYEDTDAAGMVYHARYLAFAERARAEALRAAGVPHDQLVREEGLMFVVRRVKIDYLRPARLDELLSIVTELVDLGAASASLRQSFFVAERAVAAMDVQLACVRGLDGRPQRIPERWRTALQEMQSGSNG